MSVELIRRVPPPAVETYEIVGLSAEEVRAIQVALSARADELEAKDSFWSRDYKKLYIRLMKTPTEVITPRV